MRYDPADHRPTVARMGGPLFLWAGLLLALVLLGHRGPSIARNPPVVADPWQPLHPEGRVPLPDADLHDPEELPCS